MPFRLPNGRMLSPEQVSIINLPTNKNYMITGSPGTGKTVMAIYRAGQIARYKKVLMLVYNVPLRDYLSTAIRSQIRENCEVNTYHSWIYALYRDHNLGAVPVSDDGNIIWNQAQHDIVSIGKLYNHVIIDEAQDFPIELVRALMGISDNITCFVDPNQAIEAGKTDSVELLRELCVEADFELTKNFRNTKEINNLARLFWNEDGYFAITDVPGKKPIIVHCNGFPNQCEYICNVIDQNREKNIGIIVNNKSLNNTYNEIRAGLKHPVDIQMYKSNTRHKIDFENDGVKILSYGTMKGLEFDLVLLPIVDKIKTTYDAVADTNRVYVALTRACKELYLFYFDTRTSRDRINTMELLTANRGLLEWR